MPTMTPAQMRELARRSAVSVGLDPVMFEAQLEQESGYNASATSKAGARGVAQFMPKTAKSLGIDPLDPAQAIPAAAQYMAQLKKRFGSEDLARTAYNWGEGNLAKHLQDPKAKAMPAEAQDYNTLIAGRAGVAPRQAKAAKPSDAAALQTATAELNQGLPPGALVPQPAAALAQQPAWMQALQGMQATGDALNTATPQDMLATLEDTATREQDNLLAGAFGDTALPDIPGLNNVPSAVDRYLDKLLAG